MGRPSEGKDELCSICKYQGDQVCCRSGSACYLLPRCDGIRCQLGQGFHARAPINFSFNYVGLTIGTTVAGDIDSLVLTPSTEAGTPPALLGPLSVTGTYDDASGNFTVQDAGFDFPPIGVDIDVATIDGTIGLAEAAHGNYNAATGAMTFNPKIKLTLGTSDIAALPAPIGGFGSGPLSCEFSPLDLSLSSTGTWPHAASNFAQPGAITNGSISGAFTKLPQGQDARWWPDPLPAGCRNPAAGRWSLARQQ